MIEKISKGISFKGFSSNIGGLILIAGIVWLLAGNHKLLAIITIIVGFIVFLAIKGVLIDYDKEKIKAYTDLLLLKFGKWETLNDYNKIVLKFLNESQTMNMASISRTYTTKSFDIYLENENGKKILLKEFIHYENAKEFLDKYADKLNMEKSDNYKAAFEKIEQARQQRERY
ncbi:MAG: hypothetical protein WC142_03965 [Bacteroidales bacterium]|jgi:hypothetical protein|nr:hypothetical protein [Bacteroidales bacterium]MDD2688030.1 hypothetical protein [Bacteroidales bacterium]MDD3330240.1 hypothetical protein [Bacteroidales bacterium]MDD3690999.1 hypothetical protein [Bacteroidales bacterium]MDD4044262.1 hypothetical protein [Bacteroidales bacterium]